MFRKTFLALAIPVSICISSAYAATNVTLESSEPMDGKTVKSALSAIYLTMSEEIDSVLPAVKPEVYKDGQKTDLPYLYYSLYYGEVEVYTSISENGSYELRFPAGMMSTEGFDAEGKTTGDVNEAFTVSFTLDKPTYGVVEMKSVDPVCGTSVDKIDKIKVTMESGLAGGMLGMWPMAVLKDGVICRNCTPKWNFADTSDTSFFIEVEGDPITDPGTYEINIPADMVFTEADMTTGQFSGNTNKAFTLIYTIDGESGIENIVNDADSETVYYNLQGLRVLNPTKGQIVITRKGSSVKKVMID